MESQSLCVSGQIKLPNVIIGLRNGNVVESLKRSTENEVKREFRYPIVEDIICTENQRKKLKTSDDERIRSDSDSSSSSEDESKIKKKRNMNEYVTMYLKMCHYEEFKPLEILLKELKHSRKHEFSKQIQSECDYISEEILELSQKQRRLEYEYQKKIEQIQTDLEVQKLEYKNTIKDLNFKRSKLMEELDNLNISEESKSYKSNIDSSQIPK